MVAPSGFNATISGKSAGSRNVRVLNIDYGIEIIASADSEGRSRRAFYPVVTDDSSFAVVLQFVSWAEREDFNKWMSKFMVNVSEGGAKYGTLTVRVPSRKFTRVGVPQGQLEFGEGWNDVAYTAQMTFVAASDPVEPSLKDSDVSRFQGPGGVGQAFYPAGNQIKGAGSLDAYLFDTAPSGNPNFVFDQTVDSPVIPKGAV